MDLAKIIRILKVVEEAFVGYISVNAAIINCEHFRTKSKRNAETNRAAITKPKKKFKKRQRHNQFLIRSINNQNIDLSPFMKKGYEQFFDITNMTQTSFDLLHSLVGPHLVKNSIRTPVPPKKRLLLTLIFLTTGQSRRQLAFTFKIGFTSVNKIILETCEIICTILSLKYISAPNEHEWKKIALDFRSKYNIPNCVGAIGAKNLLAQYPPHGNILKGRYIITLLATCDAHYNFTLVDVRLNDLENQCGKGLLISSELGNLLSNEKLCLPRETNLEGTETLFPYYFVGDLSIPLTKHLMKPYPGRSLTKDRQHYNSRLTGVRSTIENSFGILTARWKILSTKLNSLPNNTEKIILSTFVLHNFLKVHDTCYCPPDFADQTKDGECIKGLWRNHITQLKNCKNMGSNNSTHYAFSLRNTLCKYLNEIEIIKEKS